MLSVEAELATSAGILTYRMGWDRTGQDRTGQDGMGLPLLSGYNYDYNLSTSSFLWTDWDGRGKEQGNLTFLPVVEKSYF